MQKSRSARSTRSWMNCGPTLSPSRWSRCIGRCSRSSSGTACRPGCRTAWRGGWPSAGQSGCRRWTRGERDGRDRTMSAERAGRPPSRPPRTWRPAGNQAEPPGPLAGSGVVHSSSADPDPGFLCHAVIYGVPVPSATHSAQSRGRDTNAYRTNSSTDVVAATCDCDTRAAYRYAGTANRHTGTRGAHTNE